MRLPPDLKAALDDWRRARRIPLRANREPLGLYSHGEYRHCDPDSTAVDTGPNCAVGRSGAVENLDQSQKSESTGSRASTRRDVLELTGTRKNCVKYMPF